MKHYDSGSIKFIPQTKIGTIQSKKTIVTMTDDYQQISCYQITTRAMWLFYISHITTTTLGNKGSASNTADE